MKSKYVIYFRAKILLRTLRSFAANATSQTFCNSDRRCASLGETRLRELRQIIPVAPIEKDLAFCTNTLPLVLRWL